MQFFRQPKVESFDVVGWGVRVMLLSPAEIATDSRVAIRIAGLGGAIELADEAFAALDAMIGDSTGYGLFVIECDAFGGLDAARKLVSMLNKGGVSLPVILVSSECGKQEFPNDRHSPVVLRAPISAVGLRIGFEHALRDRLVFQTAWEGQK